MKKKKIIIISILIIITIIFVSMYFFRRSHSTIKAIVIECYENGLLVYKEKSQTLTYIGLPQNINLEFKSGQEVIIYLTLPYIIDETYPGSIDSTYIKKVKIIRDGGNTQIVERLLEQRSLREKNIRN